VAGDWAAAFVLFGLVLFALMPKFSQDAVNRRSTMEPLQAWRAGECGVPIAAVIAVFTVVGLFIGLSTLFIWYGSLYYAQVIVGALVGNG